MADVIITNEDRACKIADVFLKDHDNEGGDPDESVRDILTNIRHYCDLYGVDFGAADKMAHQHYLAEKTEPDLTPGQENQLLEAGQDEHQTNKER